VKDDIVTGKVAAEQSPVIVIKITILLSVAHYTKFCSKIGKGMFRYEEINVIGVFNDVVEG